MNSGVIEGFFGKPWAWPARRSVIDCLRDCGYQFYIYAPKGDPFLRRRWREPLPEETLRHLAELVAHGTAGGVSVGIGLTPFEIHLSYDTAARTALRSKVRQVNEVGAHRLCILFDDMRGDFDGLANIQAAVVADICSWSTAQHFIVCPTYYSYDSRLATVFGPPPPTYLRDLGTLVDPCVDVFWTGEKVISQGCSAEHLRKVAMDLQRKPFIWDNSLSNDSKIRSNHLYLDPAAGGWKLAGELVAGVAINPMNQAYLSKIALCRFRQLLATEPAAKVTSIEDCATELCGPVVATHLQEDAAIMRETGLEQMAPEIRHGLMARYEAEISSPYAQEVAAWLRHVYAFDPQCLTT